MAPEPNEKRGRGRPKKPDAERLGHVLQLRLNDAQRAYIQLLASEWDCALGEAVRRVIDERLDAEEVVDGLEIDGRPVSVREALGRFEWQVSAEWRAKHGSDEGGEG